MNVPYDAHQPLECHEVHDHRGRDWPPRRPSGHDHFWPARSNGVEHPTEYRQATEEDESVQHKPSEATELSRLGSNDRRASKSRSSSVGTSFRPSAVYQPPRAPP